MKTLSEIEDNLDKDKKDKNFRIDLFKKALSHRAKISPIVVAITGSVGKTTVKEILASILREAVDTNKHFISVKNHNTKVAIATQILEIDSDVQQVVFEVGARKVNDFEVPLSLLQPEVVVLLNVGSAHVGEFGSYENLKTEKLSVAEFPSVKTIVYNLDQNEYKSISNADKTLYSFGRNKKSDICLLEENKKHIRFSINQNLYTVAIKQLTPNLGINFVAAVATAKALQIADEFILKGLLNFNLPERRFQRLKYKDSVLIDDSFNASYESYKDGLTFFLTAYKKNKIILVLGAMKELGLYSEKLHLELLTTIQNHIKAYPEGKLKIILIDQDIQFLEPIFKKQGLETFYYKEVNEAKKQAVEWLDRGSVIYLKGAKSLGLDLIYADTNN